MKAFTFDSRAPRNRAMRNRLSFEHLINVLCSAQVSELAALKGKIEAIKQARACGEADARIEMDFARRRN